MRSRSLRAHCLGPAGLPALALLGSLGLGATPAVVLATNQVERQERYLPCTARVDRDPLCNRISARYCARECHELFS